MAGICRYVCLCLLIYIISTVSGENIKVTTIVDPPYVSWDSSKSGNDRFTGFIPDLMKAIADKKNIQYTFHKVADGRYGSQTNGVWNGLIGEVKSGKAKLAAAPITISSQRQQVVEFSKPYMTLGTVLLIARPAGDATPPVNSIKALGAQSDIQYGIIKDGMTQAFFERETSDDDFKAMWSYLQGHPNNLFTQNKDGVDKVRDSDGKFAFIMENTTAAYYAGKEPCDLMMVGDPINLKHYGFALPKSGASQLKADINDAITRLLEEGEIEKLKNKWWDEMSDCNGVAKVTMSGLLLVSVMLCKLLL